MGLALLTAMVGAVLGAVPAEARGSGATVASYANYVALGDSYTAAPGVPVTAWAQGCMRSSGNYPHLLAEHLGIKRLTDVSCSGADTADLAASQATRIRPQFDSLDSNTALITLSIGANDEGLLGGLISGCTYWASLDPSGSPCQTIAQSRGGDVLAETVARTRDRLVTAVGQARQLAPRARLVVVGYPQLLPDSGSCPDRLGIAPGDYAYVNSILALLDDAMRDAAATHGADYIDVWAASQGHDICSDSPWVAGKDAVPGQAIAYHPMPAEQAAVADLIAEALAG